MTQFALDLDALTDEVRGMRREMHAAFEALLRTLPERCPLVDAASRRVDVSGETPLLHSTTERKEATAHVGT